VLTQLLAVFFAVACIAIASTITWSNFAGSAGAPAYVTRADFDRAFADAAAGRRASKPTIRNEVDGSARPPGGVTTNVNRDRKGDRWPVLGGTAAAAPASTSNSTVVRKNAASPELANGTPARQKAFETAKPIRVPHCEPVASRFADPALGRVIGRCFV
jgi:hypothetical protein